MQLPNIKILDEKNKILRTKSNDVTFPVDKKTQELCHDMIKYLKMSQNESDAQKYNLRAGMGLAFIQVGIPKRIFVIAYENEEKGFDEYIIINPKIISESEELIYVGEGEGCLSVNREVDGIVPRNARITVEYYDFEGNKKTVRVREEKSIAFQHEIDHLNGILFVDKIDKKNPFKNADIMREI
ncbi:MAG: peptide deformylase [Firmicutes bacterium]|nr:peptide deformylase [Bacillota bacterium]